MTAIDPVQLLAIIGLTLLRFGLPLLLIWMIGKIAQAGPLIRRLLPLAGLLLLLGLLPLATVSAAPPDQGGTEKCALCHETETKAWQNSPHASQDVACENCHGPYVEDHPKKGAMQLNVDSSVCNQCHVTTYSQWKQSPHAAANVQCIGCHLSHSQNFRLTDETLCVACHRDRLNDQAHAAHLGSQVKCTDCHVSSAPGSGAVTGPGGQLAPNHSFTFAADVCAGCHIRTFQEESRNSTPVSPAAAELRVVTDQASQMAKKIDDMEQGNQVLRTLSVVNLGLGVGLGGMFGILGLLFIGWLGRGGKR